MNKKGGVVMYGTPFYGGAGFPAVTPGPKFGFGIALLVIVVILLFLFGFKWFFATLL